MEAKMNIGDWIFVFTNIITASTAVIMAYLAYRTYLKTPEQEVAHGNVLDQNGVAPKLESIEVFKTSKQRTELKITDQGLECHLHDDRHGKGGHKWTIRKNEAQQILDTANFHVNPGYKANTGTFSIGARRNWLYSKKLFIEPEFLYDTIRELLENTVK